MPHPGRRRRRRLPAFLTAAVVAASLLPAPVVAGFGVSLPRPTDTVLFPLTFRKRSSIVSSNSTSVVPSVLDNSSSYTVGRYGHAAVFVNSTNSLYFIGGEVGTEGTTITPSILSFSLNSTFLWGSRKGSSLPDNPAPFESDLPAVAWAASAVDAADAIWIFGGVVTSCDTTPLVHTLSLHSPSWAVPSAPSHLPPRRRQAKAVAVFNSTTSASDIFVFGGITDAYTCAGDTLGYLGVDRWSTADGSVESLPWDPPIGTCHGKAEFAPPVSDYSASVLRNRTALDASLVVVAGGQTAAGDLVGMESVLVFSPEHRQWSRKNVTGPTPTPRMGHTAVALESGAILIHGGLSPNRTILSDAYLLKPPFSDVDFYCTEPWSWTTLFVSSDSLSPPARAWHSATFVGGGTIVVAFGINATDVPSPEIAFLSVNETSNQGTWRDSYRVPVEVVVRGLVSNPKMDATSTSIAWAIPTTVPVSPTTLLHTTSSSTLPLSTAPSSSPASTRSASTQSSSPTPSTSAGSFVSNSSPSKKVSIAAGVGSAVAFVAILFVGALALRRRKSRGNVVLQETDSLSGPLVSTILYTRRVMSRALSLGSTLSTPSPSSTGSMGLSIDPFSDAHTVNEVGQLARASSVASVQSVPFLRSLRINSLPDGDDDPYTRIPTPQPLRDGRNTPQDWDLFSDLGTEMGEGVSRNPSSSSTVLSGLPPPIPEEPVPTVPSIHRPRTPLRVTNAADEDRDFLQLL